MLTVLLLSPRPGLDPPNGDVTYTEQLLAHPPEGVRYVPYDVAMRDGSLRERYRRHRDESLGRAAVRERDVLRFAREAAVNKARAAGLLFREPFRHFAVQPGVFDAVHVHVYSVRVEGRGQAPMVVSNSIGIEALYEHGFGMPASAVQRRRRRDAWLADRCGVMHSAYGHAGADAVVCFSEHLREAFLAGGPDDKAEYVVIPPGLEPGDEPDRGAAQPWHTGFIGDWDAKGGETVLRAHRDLRQRGLPARLTVVGSEPRTTAQESADLDITWLPRQPRDVLLRDIVPTLSAFAYPSHFDGLPLTLLEVMSRGVPVVVSDYGALPEVVLKGRAGLVVRQGDPQALAEALVSLSDPETHERLSSAARSRVEDHYDIAGVSEALGCLYRRLVRHPRKATAEGAS